MNFFNNLIISNTVLPLPSTNFELISNLPEEYFSALTLMCRRKEELELSRHLPFTNILLVTKYYSPEPPGYLSLLYYGNIDLSPKKIVCFKDRADEFNLFRPVAIAGSSEVISLIKMFSAMREEFGVTASCFVVLEKLAFISNLDIEYVIV